MGLSVLVKGIIVSLLLQAQPSWATTPVVPKQAIVKANKLVCHMNPSCKLLAEVIVYEARGEDRKGKIAVAWVVMNRVKSPAFPNTVREVVKQRGQFSYLRDKHTQEKPLQEDWEEAYEIAQAVMTGKLKSPVGHATFYHAKKKRVWWSKKMQLVASVDNHRFYVPKEKR